MQRWPGLVKVVTVGVGALAMQCSARMADAQEPWQKIQMPTAAQVAEAWKTPPPEYGPEPYYGLNGAVDETVIGRDLDRMKALGYRAVTVQAGYDMPFAYLSPEYFTFFRMFVEEAKRRRGEEAKHACVDRRRCWVSEWICGREVYGVETGASHAGAGGGTEDPGCCRGDGEGDAGGGNRFCGSDQWRRRRNGNRSGYR
jgi:hypothetical protein